MAFEWLAVASLAKEIRYSRKSQPVVYRDKLEALEKIKSVYLTQPQLIMSHPD